MMETHINLMSINQQQPEEDQWRQKSFESLSINKNLFTDICQAPSIFIFLIIIAIIQSKLFTSHRKCTSFLNNAIFINIYEDIYESIDETMKRFLNMLFKRSKNSHTEL